MKYTDSSGTYKHILYLTQEKHADSNHPEYDFFFYRQIGKDHLDKVVQVRDAEGVDPSTAVRR